MRIAWTLCISSIFVEACSGNFITRGSRLERKSYKPSTIQDFVQLKLNREFKLKVDRKAEILNEETIKNKESDRDSDLIRLREAWQSLELDSKKYQPCLNEETHLLQFDGNFKKTLECLKEINEFAKEHNNNFVYKFMLLTDDVLLINLDEKLGFQEIVGYIRHCLEGLNNLESINTENHEKLFLQLLNYLTQHRIINPSEICHLIEDPDQIFTKFLARHLHLRIEGAKSHFLWPSYRDMFLYSSETKDFQNLLREMSNREWQLLFSFYAYRRAKIGKNIQSLDVMGLKLMYGPIQVETYLEDLYQSILKGDRERQKSVHGNMFNILLDTMNQKVDKKLLFENKELYQDFYSLYYALDFIYSIKKSKAPIKNINSSSFKLVRKIMKEFSKFKQGYTSADYFTNDHKFMKQLESFRVSFNKKIDAYRSNDQINGFSFILETLSNHINNKINNIDDLKGPIFNI